MKAERRHELQTNSLAIWLMHVPEFFQKHGSKLLTLVILILVVLVGVKLYRNNARAKQDKLAAELAGVRQAISRLEQQPRAAFKNEKSAMDLDEAKSIRTDLENIIKNADNAEVKGEATLLLGDYFWAAANYPNASIPDQEESLGEAEKAYAAVIKDYSQQSVHVASAKLGLASIAENRAYLADKQSSGKSAAFWDRAKKQYEEVEKDSAAPKILRDFAKVSIQTLERIQEPLITVPAKAKPVGIEGPQMPKLPATGTAASTTKAGGYGLPIEPALPPIITTKPTTSP